MEAIQPIALACHPQNIVNIAQVSDLQPLFVRLIADGNWNSC